MHSKVCGWVCAHARVMCKNECECMRLLHSRWDHVLLRRLQWWRFSAQDVSYSQSSCCLLLLPGDIRKVKEKDYRAQDNSETLTVMHSKTPTHSFHSFSIVICTGLDYLQSFLLNESRSWRPSPPQNILLLDHSDHPTAIWRFTGSWFWKWQTFIKIC